MPVIAARRSPWRAGGGEEGTAAEHGEDVCLYTPARYIIAWQLCVS